MNEYIHSVTLDEEKCCGCTNCIKRCPTEAIRVRNGKAMILTERCIDCGECIRVCPHHAKRAKSDPLSVIDSFTYKIALPAPSLFGQFNNLSDINIVLNGLIAIGFDSVFEVARGAEIISEAARKLMETGELKKPVISCACPAIVRLIRIRFPELCDHVLPLLTPMEVSARLAKKQASEKTGLPEDQIGVFFISPCPAKVTEAKAPMATEKSAVDGVIAISRIYPQLSAAMDKLTKIEPLAFSGIIGVGWANSGGEATGMLNDKYLAADGIENAIRVLDELEDERINDIDFIELNACHGGCVGGVLTIENPYIAQARVQLLKKHLPVSKNHALDNAATEFHWTNTLNFTPVLKLSDNLEEAMEMMTKIDEITKNLPNLDCGSCGSPSCHAMAEDIVKGNAKITDCIFVLKEQLQAMAKSLSSLS
ncbi:MAG: [Fe-Fe] hydrogenase large subunit C-terminal domain-containing protein [Bacillota bacterium]|nr:[Fe-Fe] hydrogenase large subunit C-terminal domain-containing protein [Bacillota bacterium]